MSGHASSPESDTPTYHTRDPTARTSSELSPSSDAAVMNSPASDGHQEPANAGRAQQPPARGPSFTASDLIEAMRVKNARHQAQSSATGRSERADRADGADRALAPGPSGSESTLQTTARWIVRSMHRWQEVYYGPRISDVEAFLARLEDYFQHPAAPVDDDATRVETGLSCLSQSVLKVLIKRGKPKTWQDFGNYLRFFAELRTATYQQKPGTHPLDDLPTLGAFARRDAFDEFHRAMDSIKADSEVKAVVYSYLLPPETRCLIREREGKDPSEAAATKTSRFRTRSVSGIFRKRTKSWKATYAERRAIVQAARDELVITPPSTRSSLSGADGIARSGSAVQIAPDVMQTNTPSGLGQHQDRPFLGYALIHNILQGFNDQDIYATTLPPSHPRKKHVRIGEDKNQIYPPPDSPSDTDSEQMAMATVDGASTTTIQGAEDVEGKKGDGEAPAVGLVSDESFCSRLV